MPKNDAIYFAEMYRAKAEAETDPAGKATYWGLARMYYKDAEQWNMVAYCFKRES